MRKQRRVAVSLSANHQAIVLVRTSDGSLESDFSLRRNNQPAAIGTLFT